MLVFVVLVFVSATTTARAEGCELPAELRGEWQSSLSGWQDLSISNTTISKLPVTPDFTSGLDFSCFLHDNGTKYLLRSPEKRLSTLRYNFYICLDIVPSTTTPYLTYFRILTDESVKDPDTGHKDFTVVFTDKNATMEDICNRNATELPMDFSYFVKKDYEQVMGNETCPRVLQAEFSVNLTGQDQLKCPQGFELDGCDLSHLVFNYSHCGGGDQGYGSGSVSYTCLGSLEKGGVTYTIILLKDETQSNNPFEFTCLTEKEEDGLVTITKNPGKCRATPDETTVTMEAKETVSCRAEVPPTSEAPTTPAGSENTTTPGTSSSSTSTSSPGGTGTGEGGEGGGGCSMYSMGFTTLLLPALVSMLVAVNM